MTKKTLNYILIGVVVLTSANFIWSWQKNVYSKSLVTLEILGSSEISVGKEVEYVVRYKNKSDFRLDDPELIFEAPEHSMQGDEFIERKILGADELGEAIYPSEEKTFTFRLKVLGKEGEVRIAKAFLSYQPKDLKARYESSSEFTSQINSVPLTFDFDLPTKIASGKESVFRINYFSNADSVLTGLRCQVEYPGGFEFVKSSPNSIDQTEWEIPVLNKSEGGRIDITGSVSGGLGEAKVFKARLGVWNNGEFIVLKEAEKGIELVEHSLYLRQEINGNPQYVAVPGEWLHYEVYFKNIGDDAVSNLFMVNQLEGDAFDFQTIKSDYGSFQAGDSSVVFDWRNVSALQYLIPKQEAKVDFWIKLKDDLGSVSNPVLKNKVFIGQVKEEFVTKIGSKLGLDQKVYFQDEIFGNSGVNPPQVGETNTYTVIWNVRNYYSDVKNVRVTALLPYYVELTGRVFPGNAINNFTFDSNSREIVWLAGDMSKGVGVTEPPLTIAFQVALTPVPALRGLSPYVINKATVTGEDSWTQSLIEATSPAVSTSLPDDSTVNNGTVQ